MERKKSFKRKEEGNSDDRKGKEKGYDCDKGKEPSKGGGKERSERTEESRAEEHEPIIRRSALARTPPEVRASSTLAYKHGREGKIHLEGTERATGEDGRDRESEKRKRKPESPEDSVEVIEVFEGENTAVDLLMKRKAEILRSPLRKIGRVGSFSDVEGKLYGRRGSLRKEGEEEVKENADEGRRRNEDQTGGRGRETVIQILKRKFRILKEEVDGDILKTAEIDRILGEVSDLIDQAEMEEGVRIEEEKDSSLKQRRIINGMIKGTDTYDKFKVIEDEVWPRECFTKTIVKMGECPVREGDTVLWKSTGDAENEKGAARLWKESLPELSEMTGGIWETLVMKSRRVSRGREEREWERRVHVNQEAEGPELFEKLKELRDHLKDLGVNSISMALEDDMEVEVLSKLLECIMREEGIHRELIKSK